jgi:MSHA biogenesis protein MshQ
MNRMTIVSSIVLRWLASLLRRPQCFILLISILSAIHAMAAVTELNSTGGTNVSNGLHFYIEDTTHIQVRRLNNTGQVYDNAQIPPHVRLDNGIFLWADNKLYGPSFQLTTVGISPTMYNTYSVTAPSPANPATLGVPQMAASAFGIASGPQVSVSWKYVLPYDFITAEVTVTIPSAYPVSASNPIRYYHVVDTYLGGSDNGCGVTYINSDGKRVAGTYPPTGNSCPTSSSVPSGVNIVEYFRERSGLSFSHYCTTLWSNFWASANSGTACAVQRGVSFSDTVSTKYQDTGIGIEYDFTAAGTYKFSYDFVIGSPAVPAYDHLEIQHDGSSTLCSDNVTVLACTSSTVPCPLANYVVSGTLTGAVTTTPATPAVTKAPTTFSIGSAASTATVGLLGASPGGTYTLGSSGLSSVPLNGTKCWNTATKSASCTFVVANTPCVSNFECLETGLAYNNLTTNPTARNPLYTKPVATDFKFDVVALQTGGVQAASYTAAANVTVELFDDSAASQPACSAYANPVATQSITFAAADGGRKTLSSNINLTKAYRKLRCRVKDTNITPTVYGCSSDDFTVRPQAFSSIASSNASADSTGMSASATPTVIAGRAFSLSADTDVVGYDNTPQANPSLLEWLNVPTGGRASPGTGTLGGSFSTAASAATGNGASGSFTYDEVGYFRFKENGVFDDTFTSYSGDKAAGDCVTDGFSNTADANGKHGCNFGNTEVSDHFGRFIPDHFDTSVTQACVRDDSVESFTYSGQPFPLTITARNQAGGEAANYSGAFARQVSLTARDAADTADNPGPGSLSLTNVPASAFSGGIARANPSYAFTNQRTAQTAVRVRAAESEVTSLRSPTSLTVEGSASILSGRARIANAYGSELLDLPMVFRTESWNGSGWVLNALDSCTGDTTLDANNAVSVALASNPAALPTCIYDTGNPGLSGAGCAAAAAVSRQFKEGATPTVGFAGDFNLWLRAPGAGNFGTTVLNATVPTWLGVVPPAMATFGRYKTPLIYRREVFQ